MLPNTYRDFDYIFNRNLYIVSIISFITCEQRYLHKPFVSASLNQYKRLRLS